MAMIAILEKVRAPSRNVFHKGPWNLCRFWSSVSLAPESFSSLFRAVGTPATIKKAIVGRAMLLIDLKAAHLVLVFKKVATFSRAIWAIPPIIKARVNLTFTCHYVLLSRCSSHGTITAEIINFLRS